MMYNTSIEINEAQYKTIKSRLSSICMTRTKDGRYWYKLMFTSYSSIVQTLLDAHEL